MTPREWFDVAMLVLAWLAFGSIAADLVRPSSTGGKVLCLLVGPAFLLPATPVLIVVALVVEGKRLITTLAKRIRTRSARSPQGGE